jgi:CRISPR-associated protein Cst1
MTTATEPAVHVKWTGHPLVDVGVATLCALANVDDPAELTLDDLDKAGDEIRRAYEMPSMTGFITCVYMNSAYVQPATREKNPDTYKALVTRMALPHRAPPDPEAAGLRCVFTGEPAHLVLNRTEVPMLTGVDILNFFPSGQSGLAVSAGMGQAIHAMALGGRRSEGKLLIVHSDSPALTLEFARKYVRDNRRLISLLRSNAVTEVVVGPVDEVGREMAGGWDKKNNRPKYPDVKAPESFVMTDLIEISTAMSSAGRMSGPVSVTTYHMSNSGQGPSLAIEHIPGPFVRFLTELQGPKFGTRWNALVNRAWRAPKGEVEENAEGEEAAPKKSRAKKDKGPGISPGAGRSRNDLYNDLLPIFSNGFLDWWAATRFVRRHLLCNPKRFFLFDNGYAGTAPRLDANDFTLIDWELTAHFLREVLGMKDERIKAIQNFADRLAEIIDDHNDKRLFQGLVYTSKEWEYRALLTKVQRQYANDRNQLLFGLDQYLDLFLQTDGGGPSQWSLVRDLISIRLVEELFKRKFFDREGNRDALKGDDKGEQPAE